MLANCEDGGGRIDVIGRLSWPSAAVRDISKNFVKLSKVPKLLKVQLLNSFMHLKVMPTVYGSKQLIPDKHGL